MIRMIFSTVRAPHDPALTVESFAISATGRPPIGRGPGDHAVRGQPVGQGVGVPAVLGEAALVDQERDPLPGEQLAAAPRRPRGSVAAPPRSMVSRSFSEIGHGAIVLVRGPARSTWEGRVAADDALGLGGGRDHRVQVDAGRHAHVLDHVHEFLGGDVAGRAGRVRAAAQAADGGVEVGHAEFQGGQHVGQPGAPGVVEVQVQRRSPGWAERNAPTSARTRVGVAMPVVSPNEAESAPSAMARPATDTTRAHRHVALVRAAPRGGHDHLHGGAAVVRDRDDLGDLVERLPGGPVDVLAVVRLRGGDDRLQLGEARVQGAQRAAQVGHQGGVPAPRAPGPPASTPRRRRPSAGSPTAGRTTPPRSAARRSRTARPAAPPSRRSAPGPRSAARPAARPRAPRSGPAVPSSSLQASPRRTAGHQR